MRPKGVVDGEQVDIPALAYNRYYWSRDAVGYVSGLNGLPSKRVARVCRQIRRFVTVRRYGKVPRDRRDRHHAD